MMVIKIKILDVTVSNVFAQDWNQFELLGGWLCLDFANTVNRENGTYTEEWLTNYADLVSWGKHAQILTPQQANSLLEVASTHPEEAKTVFESAIALRETIYRIFSAVAVQRSPASKDIQDLNTALAQTMGYLQISATNEGFIWTWIDAGNRLDTVLWQIIRSAGELLTTAILNRVRECAADDCSFLFVDMSRNRSRCWCDMESCGNRSKAKRHYARKKERLS